MSGFVLGLLFGAGVMLVRDLLRDAATRREVRAIEARVRRARELRRDAWRS